MIRMEMKWIPPAEAEQYDSDDFGKNPECKGSTACIFDNRNPYGEYRVVEISSTPDTVKLKGASNVLNPLVSLEIPANVINVSGAREDVKTTIDISEYLPDGVDW